MILSATIKDTVANPPNTINPIVTFTDTPFNSIVSPNLEQGKEVFNPSSLERLKKIPQMFATNGLKYSLLQRIRGVALYEVYGKQGTKGYEVHLIRKKRYPSIFSDNTFTHMEVLAKNNEFGMYGWAISDKALAWLKFQEKVKVATC